MTFLFGQRVKKATTLIIIIAIIIVYIHISCMHSRSILKLLPLAHVDGELRTGWLHTFGRIKASMSSSFCVHSMNEHLTIVSTFAATASPASFECVNAVWAQYWIFDFCSASELAARMQQTAKCNANCFAN